MKWAPAVFLLLLTLICGGCQTSAVTTRTKPSVVTSLPPYVSLVQAIVGDTMTVDAALGDTFDPHTAEVTPRQMAKVHSADLFIGVGEPYEKKLLATVRQGKPLPHILKLNEKIPLLACVQDGEGGHGSTSTCSIDQGVDLHFWLGPKSLMLQVAVLVEALSSLCPHHATHYKIRGDHLIETLQALDARIQKDLAQFRDRAVIVSHPTLGYFCHEYDLIQLPIESEGKEPLPRDAGALLTLAKRSNVICVFTSPQSNNSGAIFIGKQLHLRIESFDPLARDPLETIQHVAALIAR